VDRSDAGRPSFARAVVRHRLPLALAWVVLALALLPVAGRLEDRLDVGARIPGSESADVERTLVDRFESPFARSAVLVLSGVGRPSSEDGRRALTEVVGALRSAPGVTRTFSYLDEPDPFFEGEGAGTFVVVGLRADAAGPEALLPALRERTREIRSAWRARNPAADLAWTGEAAINYDLWRTSTSQARSAERRALPVTLLLLLFAFGSVVAAFVPVGAGVLAVVLALGTASLASARLPLSVLIVNVVSMLGLALGIDYALLTVSRFREARAAGRSVEEAAEDAALHAGRTVALSGVAVAIGFAALLWVPLSELRSAAFGGLVVVVVSVLLNLTLLPGLLAMLGPRLDAGRLLPGRAHSDGSRARAWARHVIAHPWRVLVLAGVPLLVLAAQAVRLNPRVPRGDWLPAELESTRGLGALGAMGRGGVVESLRVVVELPAEVSTLSREGWQALRRVERSLGRDPRVARVQSLARLAGGRGDDLDYVSLLPAEAKRTFLSPEGDAALLEVVPRESLHPADASDFARELRRADAAFLAGLPGVRLRVGGLPGFNADYEDAVRGRARAVVLIVVVATLVSLLAAFRSVLVPLKAVALNLLAVTGAMGALVLVFQDGYGVRLLGLARPLDGVFPIVPLLAFCTVFGPSMDYEVFLVARVREARRGGLGEDDALAFGLARTAGLITSAAAIMIAVFVAFMSGGFVLVKMLGLALAVAVLLDATVIRMAIGPALLRLAGRFNWWPGG
jgi:RND superfamily putative drug exporter